ncbi:exopolyphosphatase PRUNE1-like isoform X1 [Eurosta solidaginis]|uniref:exopolyphosphatase PRUNE1-like isoform X1 n=1 Tax=Eurosta solidaginis TaxID=178769 RepID=UPI003530CE41
MLNFLKHTRKFVNSTESICIILGNESCDLDSAVCAIALAYHYQQQSVAKNKKEHHFLPVLNIPRSDYPLKTEVKYVFDKHEISLDNLSFRDELQEDFLARSKFILVDHHVSPFAARCLEVFDHRTFDEKTQLPSFCRRHIELVGSCATLIGEHLLKVLNTASHDDMLKSYEPLLQMLRGAIILDTVNFSEAANRTTPKDLQICANLEELLTQLTDQKELLQRTELFDGLVAARANISNLSSLQLLRKDLKILTTTNASLIIALPGFPILVEQFVQKPDAVIAVQEFAKHVNATILLLMGMLVTNGSIQRDLGFIDMGAEKLCAGIREKLLSTAEPALCLQKYEDINFLNGHFYRMNNIKATRKHILPLVKQLLDNWGK